MIGIGDWGLRIGDWGIRQNPNPQNPIPKPQSPKLQEINYKVNETKNAFPKFIDSSNDWSKRQKYYELNDTIYNLSSHNFYANKTIDNNIITFQWNELDFAQIWLDPFKETNNNYSLLRKDNPI